VIESDSAATLEHSLVELERELWLRAGDAEFYEEHLDRDAVMVFPAPFGAIDRATTLEAVTDSSAWDGVEFEELRFVDLADDTAALAYRARGTRAGEDYATYAASVYVRRGGTWKLALHQQTPVPEQAA
jgi:hypothetical protein